MTQNPFDNATDHLRIKADLYYTYKSRQCVVICQWLQVTTLHIGNCKRRRQRIDR